MNCKLCSEPVTPEYRVWAEETLPGRSDAKSLVKKAGAVYIRDDFGNCEEVAFELTVLNSTVCAECLWHVLNRVLIPAPSACEWTIQQLAERFRE